MFFLSLEVNSSYNRLHLNEDEYTGDGGFPQNVQMREVDKVFFLAGNLQVWQLPNIAVIFFFFGVISYIIC